jgi:hypothetical protein
LEVRAFCSSTVAVISAVAGLPVVIPSLARVRARWSALAMTHWTRAAVVKRARAVIEKQLPNGADKNNSDHHQQDYEAKLHEFQCRPGSQF